MNKSTALQYGAHDSGRESGGQKQRRGQPEIERRGTSIVLPEKLELNAAIKALEHVREQEESERCISHPIDVLPHEGAIALREAVRDMFGLVLEDGGGSNISVEVGPGKTTQVRWGRYELPTGGFIEPGTTTAPDGRMIFKIHAHVQGKHEHMLLSLIERIEQFANTKSPWRGQAFNIELTDKDGDPLTMPVIKFLQLPAHPVQAIFRQGITRDIRTHIIGPIEKTARIRAQGIPLKRGVLLAGTYGTGKTLTATWTAQTAIANGWTFIYLTKPEELVRALSLAAHYGPSVLFVEDVDRITGLERTDKINAIVNALDGVDGKTRDVMVVATTNHPEKINPAMRRPGRLDTAIHLLPPDAEAAIGLVQLYAGNDLAPDQDLQVVGSRLDGQIPARIREAVERAKLSAIAVDRPEIALTSEDLVYAAESLEREHQLFNPKDEDESETAGQFSNRLDRALPQVGSNGHASAVELRSEAGTRG